MGAPPITPNAEVVDEMRSKHPVGDSAPSEIGSLRAIDGAAAPNVDEDAIHNALRSFPRWSASGPSGLRPSHLREGMVPGVRDQMLTSLSHVVKILLDGRAPQAIQCELAGATLVAIPKKDGGLRPIAVGECIRRLAGKVAMETVGRSIGAEMCPLQVGVGVAGGAEAVIHASRSWQKQNRGRSDKIFAQVDLENAFNSIFRTHVRQIARERMPSLTPWVDFCYASDTALHLCDFF